MNIGLHLLEMSTRSPMTEANNCKYMNRQTTHDMPESIELVFSANGRHFTHYQAFEIIHVYPLLLYNMRLARNYEK